MHIDHHQEFYALIRRQWVSAILEGLPEHLHHLPELALRFETRCTDHLDDSALLLARAERRESTLP
jgi:hypothetical protein